MEHVHRECLRKNFVHLSEHLELTSLYSALFQEGVFPWPWIESIKGERSEPERRQKLVTDLKKRGPTAWQKFLKCLDKTGQSDTANLLRRTEEQMKFGNTALPRNVQPVPAAPVQCTEDLRTPIQEQSPQESPQSTVTPELDTGANDQSLSYRPSTQIHFQPQMCNSSSSTQNGPSISDILHLSVQPGVRTDGRNPADEYSITSTPRGYALIINNRHFQPNYLEERKGTNIDCQNIEQLLLKLGFHTDVKWNLNQQQMASTIESFASYEGHAQVDSCAFVILTHGDQGQIFGTDGRPVSIDSIKAKFDCDSLVGKPKLFIIQACRGKQFNYGQVRTDAPTEPNTTFQASGIQRIPLGADMILAFSTLRGFVSVRDEVYGTWFISDLCKIFSEHAHNRHVLDMLTMVNDKVAQRECGESGMKQMPQPETTLRKMWFFNPPVEDG